LPVHAGAASWNQPEDRCQVEDAFPIGFFHIDLAEVKTAEGKLACQLQ
jgi:hypothetical protein